MARSWFPVGRACVLLVGVGLVTSGCGAAAVNTGKRADERITYCLDESRRANLTEVATRLGIAAPSGDAVQNWRGTDFDRACDAMMAANGHSVVATGPAIPQWLTDLLNVLKSVALLLAGAVLTLLTGGLRAAGTRRRLQAAQLRTATDNFVAACETFLEDRLDSVPDTTSGQTLRDRRQDLLAKLRESKALYRRKVTIGPLLTLLTGRLGRSIQRDWELSGTDEQRRDRVKKVRAALTDLVRDIEDVNRKLERSVLARLGGTT